MTQTLVTTYKNPDIDGVAACLTYAEILKKHGAANQVLFWGKPQPEVDFMVQKFNLNLPFYTNQTWDKVIVLDTASTKRLPPEIDPKNVTEIIDHHPTEDGKEFPSAKIQSEEVGAVATLVVERLQKENISVSNDLATLLYVAIYQNTLNMLVGVTDRDKNASAYLANNYKVDQKLVEEMFNYVVAYTLKNLQTVLESDYKEFEFDGKKCVGGQVLFYDAKPHLQKVVQAVNTSQIFRNHPFFVKADDLKFNKTYMYCPDIAMQNVLAANLKIDFRDNWTQLSPIILRKKTIKALSAP